MLVRLCANPDVFGVASVADTRSRDSAVQLLKAILNNGVLVCRLGDDIPGHLRRAAESITSEKAGQRVRMLVEELLKARKRHIARLAEPGQSDIGAAKWMAEISRQVSVDGFICCTPLDAAYTSEILPPSQTACWIGEYLDATLDDLFDTFRQDQALHPDGVRSNGETARSLLNRIVAHTPRIVLVDKMIAIAAHGNNMSQLRKHICAVTYLADVWKESRLRSRADQRLDVEILTVGGNVGALGQNIQPSRLRPIIERCIRSEDRHQHVGNVDIAFKVDDKRLFHDRLIWSAHRCYNILPGLDGIGQLVGPANGAFVPSHISPDSEARRRQLMELLRLPNVQE